MKYLYTILFTLNSLFVLAQLPPAEGSFEESLGVFLVLGIVLGAYKLMRKK